MSDCRMAIMDSGESRNDEKDKLVMRSVGRSSLKRRARIRYCHFGGVKVFLPEGIPHLLPI